MGRERILIEVIRIDKTQHKHTFLRKDNLNVTFKDKNEDGENFVINVEPKDLYEVRINLILGFLVNIFTGRQKHYIMVVNNKGKPISEIAPEVSGKVLKVARDWKGLGQAINDAFGSRFQLGKGVIILVIAIGIVVLGVLVYTGYIPIPKGIIK